MPPTLASRLNLLGTETAYKISADAAVLEAEGKTVYRFHIGDLSFKPPKEFAAGVAAALEEGKTGYCLARGILPLRVEVAKRCGKERGYEITPDQVCIQPGGKSVIMKFLLATMNAGDAVMYPTPGYPLYESLIRFFGGIPLPYEYKEGPNGIELDWSSIERHLKPSSPVVKAFIINSMHNPTGHVCTIADLQRITDLAVGRDWWVLSDEAYWGMCFDVKPMSISSFPGMQDRTCILLTCSKEWAMTGMRCGVALGPKVLIDPIEKLAVNDEGCVNQAVQWGSIPCFQGHCDYHTEHIRGELRKRRDVVVDLLNRIIGFHAASPVATFYLWVNATSAYEILKSHSYEDFRLRILHDTGVAFCTREHFGDSMHSEHEKFIRFSFAGITVERITEAMGALQAYMEKHCAESPRLRIFSSAFVPTEIKQSPFAKRLTVDCWNANHVPTDPKTALLSKAKNTMALLLLPEHMPKIGGAGATWEELLDIAGSSLQYIIALGQPEAGTYPDIDFFTDRGVQFTVVSDPDGCRDDLQHDSSLCGIIGDNSATLICKALMDISSHHTHRHPHSPLPTGHAA